MSPLNRTVRGLVHLRRLDGDRQAGRTQHVPRVVEAHARVIVQHVTRAELHRVQHLARLLGVLAAVQRFDRILGRPLLLLEAFRLVPRVLLLNPPRVRHHNPGQFRAGLGGDDPPLEPLVHQLRDPPAVVQVGVGQQQHVDRLGRHRAVFPVAAQELAFLKHAVVDHDAKHPPPVFQAGDFEQVAGSGDLAVGAEEGEFHRDLQWVIRHDELKQVTVALDQARQIVFGIRLDVFPRMPLSRASSARKQSQRPLHLAVDQSPPMNIAARSARKACGRSMLRDSNPTSIAPGMSRPQELRPVPGLLKQDRHTPTEQSVITDPRERGTLLGSIPVDLIRKVFAEICAPSRYLRVT